MRGSIHAALSSLEGPYVETEGDSLREDLAVLLWHLVEYFDRPDIGRVFASFIDAAARDPELAELHQETMRRARASFEQVVRRGIERGELPADVDVGLLHRRRTRAVHLPPRRRADQPSSRRTSTPVVDLVLGAFSPVPK